MTEEIKLIKLDNLFYFGGKLSYVGIIQGYDESVSLITGWDYNIIINLNDMTSKTIYVK